MFTPSSETYSTSEYTPTHARQREDFDTTGYSSAETTVLPDTSSYDPFNDEVATKTAGPVWHAGADLGLLVLRIVLGGLFIAHGLGQLFGWFQGPGLDGTEQQLASFGFSNTTALAWVTGVTGLVGGVFVLLGLFTPIGSAAMLGLMGSAIWVKFDGGFFAGHVELESIYAAAAFAILFAGPGRVSLDRPTPWYRNASAFGVVFFIVAVGAMVAMLVVFR
jgi:putative oxidoreductase